MKRIAIVVASFLVAGALVVPMCRLRGSGRSYSRVPRRDGRRRPRALPDHEDRLRTRELEASSSRRCWTAMTARPSRCACNSPSGDGPSKGGPRSWTRTVRWSGASVSKGPSGRCQPRGRFDTPGPTCKTTTRPCCARPATWHGPLIASSPSVATVTGCQERIGGVDTATPPILSSTRRPQPAIQALVRRSVGRASEGPHVEAHRPLDPREPRSRQPALDRPKVVSPGASVAEDRAGVASWLALLEQARVPMGSAVDLEHAIEFPISTRIEPDDEVGVLTRWVEPLPGVDPEEHDARREVRHDASDVRPRIAVVPIGPVS